MFEVGFVKTLLFPCEKTESLLVLQRRRFTLLTSVRKQVSWCTKQKKNNSHTAVDESPGAAGLGSLKNEVGLPLGI